MSEQWLSVRGYLDLYEVSSHGRVRSLPRRSTRRNRVYGGALLTPSPMGSGYYGVRLSANNVKKTYALHVLVCEAFHGPAPDGQEVRHLDGDGLNCWADNLTWGTHSENELDCVKHGTHYNAAKTHCIRQHRFDKANTRWYTGQNGRQHRACIACSKL